MFSGEFCEVSKNIFPTEPLRTTTSDRRRRANSRPQPKILEITKMIIIAKQNIKKLILISTIAITFLYWKHGANNTLKTLTLSVWSALHRTRFWKSIVYCLWVSAVCPSAKESIPGVIHYVWPFYAARQMYLYFKISKPLMVKTIINESPMYILHVVHKFCKVYKNMAQVFIA